MRWIAKCKAAFSSRNEMFREKVCELLIFSPSRWIEKWIFSISRSSDGWGCVILRRRRNRDLLRQEFRSLRRSTLLKPKRESALLWLLGTWKDQRKGYLLRRM